MSRGMSSWLALAVRAQGYRSEARRHALQSARTDQALAGALAREAEEEVASVLNAWQLHRGGTGMGVPLEDSYRLFYAHVQAQSRQASAKEHDAIVAADAALEALRECFSRQLALQAVELRAHADLQRERLREEGRTLAETWLLGRSTRRGEGT